MTVVAIDGPAGAGKSTVARALARRLGFRYVDTGGMYRAVALAVIEAGLDPAARDGLTALLERIEVDADEGRVQLQGRDVTARVRDADVTALVSRVAADLDVRKALVRVQRRLAEETHVVMEGRDIGTAVVPEADVKVFLTATLGARAQRRWRQEAGAGATVAEVEAAVAARDAADERRSVSPLVRASDAVVIDTTDLSIDEVVDEIAALVHAGGRT